MIKSIRAIARKLRGKRLPQDITPARVANLRALVAQPEWKSYQALLETLVESHGEAILTTSDNVQLHYLRGLIVGLRESTLFAERIAAQETYARRDNTAARAARRAAALYATAAWPNADIK